MKALIFFQTEEARNLLSFFLLQKFNIDSVVVATKTDAIQKLTAASREGPFDFVVCDYPQQGVELITETSEKKIDIHFFCGAQQVPKDLIVQVRKEWIHFYPASVTIQGLEIALKKFYNSLKSIPELEESKNCWIDPKLLPHSNPLIIDFYIKLSEKKLIRVIQVGEDFTDFDLEHYSVQKKINSFYFDKNKCTQLAAQIEKNLKLKGMWNRSPNSLEEVQAATSVVKSLNSELGNILGLADRMGFTQEVQFEVRKQVSQTIELY